MLVNSILRLKKRAHASLVFFSLVDGTALAVFALGLMPISYRAYKFNTVLEFRSSMYAISFSGWLHVRLLHSFHYDSIKFCIVNATTFGEFGSALIETGQEIQGLIHYC